ncbi:MAG: hypothetical protein V4507_06920, partial [Verrucomicrobiota bacterium]
MNKSSFFSSSPSHTKPSLRGQLKVFLGTCSGVGKTYAMLESAKLQIAQGTDVVVAFVKTHGSRKTEKLLQGIPHLSRQKKSQTERGVE